MLEVAGGWGDVSPLSACKEPFPDCVPPVLRGVVGNTQAARVRA